MEKIILILLGFIIGSFLNVVIYRIPLKKNIVKPRSYCPSCQNPIRFYDNIPVISFLILGGKCRDCKKRIPFQYPLVEILTSISFYLSYVNFNSDPVYMVFSIIFLCLLICLAFIDLNHMILPDIFTLGGAVIFLTYSPFNPSITFLNSIATALGSSLVFLLLYFFYLKVRKIEGLGFGDIKMMLLLGAYLGYEKMIMAAFIASLTGLFVGLYFIFFKKKDLKFALPFGVFLSLGSYVSFFWGDKILKSLHFFLI